MAGASDKARFFLEQSVPELKEYEKKKIFSGEEITSIARKRSDFEHKINARGSTPADYARYAEFEMNVEALRRKRVKRLGIKTTNHTGQRRIFFVFDRGTRKHPGDVGLWMQSLEFARRQKAYKKLSQIYTNVLRLHPTKSELWIYAAQSVVEEHADITEARSYMQRGLRFCKGTKSMWIEYARLEMSYIAKIHARRRILGIAGGDERTEAGDLGDEDENMLRLPRLTADDINPELEEGQVDDQALQTLESTPAMSGAIPRAIFDAAMSQFPNDVALNYDFFDMFSAFDNLPVVTPLLRHVTVHLEEYYPASWQCCASQIRMPLVGLDPSSPEYPAALRKSLTNFRQGRSDGRQRLELSAWATSWLNELLKAPDLDEGVQTVIKSVLRSVNSD